MQIQLTLLEDGPPFFFLGDPKKLSLSLTYQDPGPQAVDFSALSLADQKKVLMHILVEKVKSNVAYQDLYQEYQKIFSQSAPAEPQVDKPVEKPVQPPAGAKKPAKIPEQYMHQEEQFQEKCKKLVKKSLKLLKEELKESNDTRMLQTVRNLELQKRSPRASVLNFVELQLRKCHQEIINSIENDANTVTIKTGSPVQGEQFVSDVIESEQEIVQLTPDMLIDQKVE